MAQATKTKRIRSGNAVPPRHRSRAGFTLIEVMISVVIGIIVVASILAMTIVSTQNFAATSNYVNMDTQSRNAMDRISREIRNASFVSNYVANTSLVLINANKNSTINLTYNSTSNSITLTTNQVTTATLTGCTNFSLQLLSRDFQTSTNPPVDGKVVNMSWKCSRRIIGSTFNTEVAQTAQVVLRN
jgi:Tfp pilus assembly protein PilW